MALEDISILVVEDTLPMLSMICSTLNILGVRSVYRAKNGEEGFEEFVRKTPDIVITDWLMEPVNGLELIKKIRTDSRSPYKTVPIIMITGYSALKRVQQARDYGVTEFLVKPFTANAIATRLNHIIDRPRGFVEAEDYFGPDRRRKREEDYTGPLRRGADFKYD